MWLLLLAVPVAVGILFCARTTSSSPTSNNSNNNNINNNNNSNNNHLSVLSDSGFCISKGETGIIIGQDVYSAFNYSEVYGQSFGYMAYITLSSNTSTESGLGLSIANDYGAGLQFVSALHHKFPTSHLQLGLYLVDLCDDVTSGKLDNRIAYLIDYIANNLTGIRVYLRIGYEFDLPANHYDPLQFIDAFRYIVNKFRESAVNNVEFVWHSSLPLKSKAKGEDLTWFQPWFPGREFVNWCGISIFEQPYSCQSPFNCFIDSMDSFLGFCEGLDIDSMIAESSPFGGILDDQRFYRHLEEEKEEEETHSEDVEERSLGGNVCGVRPFQFYYKDDEASSYEHNEAGIAGSTWSRWFVPVLSFVNRYEIRIWSYINNDWDALPMWRKEHSPDVYWGDSRVQCYRGTKLHWEREVLLDPRFKWSSAGKYNPSNGHVDFFRSCSLTGGDDDDDDDDGDSNGGWTNSTYSNSSIANNNDNNDSRDSDKSLAEKIGKLRSMDYPKYLAKCFAGRTGFPFWCSFYGVACYLLSLAVLGAIVYYFYKQFYEHSNQHRYVVIR